jgi:hypothetical protein
MVVHVFSSTQIPQILAFTLDPEGANLPSGLRPWKTSSKKPAFLNERATQGVLPIVEAFGYHISAEPHDFLKILAEVQTP